NLRNPNEIFGKDPFGVKLAPDYAVRFSGYLRITTAGDHTFFLGADEGARLKVGGITVVDIPTGNGQYQEGRGPISLAPGLIHIEVTFYESVGNIELQL